MLRIGVILVLVISCCLTISAQSPQKEVEDIVSSYFNQYTTDVQIRKSTLQKLEVDERKKSLTIYVSEGFANQPFTPSAVDRIYRELKNQLPRQFNSYKLTVYTEGKTIESLVPNLYRKRDKDKSRMHPKGIDELDNGWVTNISKPYTTKDGLSERYIGVGQSHGMYYNTKSSKWEWQRPNLFCTTEDLLTQSFVLPYLIPMLENAGATVVTPRERDTQTSEVIVDNDLSNGSLYIEEGSRKNRWTTSAKSGFAQKGAYLRDGENPFTQGTARYIGTEKKKDKAFAQWIPSIEKSGSYAVYVSYQTLPNSVSDAKYMVFHNGGITEFTVNQQIGGGTWVYLGTFDFDKGRDITGMVILTNQSKEKGVVSADAVRFGGGKGNIVRGYSISGMPRFLEGARYTAQWYGMPYSVYGGRSGENDYIDDINARSYMINYLSGGSAFNPKKEGLGVPIELYLALHTDAGYSSSDGIIGSLGIYTPDFNDGKLNNGTDRYASRDLSDILLTELQSDIRSTFRTSWTRRALRGANYSETRLPSTASTIIELLSHQNFADMKWAHDPNFKFTSSRALYKGVLKYISQQYNKPYTVQPLPVSHFSVNFGKKKNTLELAWMGEEDPLEPSASPEEYIVYTRINNGAFDNGVRVKSPFYALKVKPDLIYSFKVTAVNRGGESFPSETLAASIASKERGRVLIVNGFDRVAGPAVVNSSSQAGFDLQNDPGVPYLYTTALAGAQQVFDRKQGGKEGKGSLGYCENEWAGAKIAGNSFDYPFVHGKAIQAAGGYSFVSCSDEAVEDGLINLNNYSVVNLILGLEKEDPNNTKYYKTFTTKMQNRLQNYCNSGGSVLVSGSYIGSDMNNSESERRFTQNVLKYGYQSTLRGEDSSTVTGLGTTARLSKKPNDMFYTLTAPESLQPMSSAFAAMAYSNNTPAAVAYKGNYRTFVMGFPFENIENETQRAQIMASILHFLQIK